MGHESRDGVGCYLDSLTKITDCVHMPAERNRRADCLYRRGSWEEVLKLDTEFCGGDLISDKPRLSLVT